MLYKPRANNQTLNYISDPQHPRMSWKGNKSDNQTTYSIVPTSSRPQNNVSVYNNNSNRAIRATSSAGGRISRPRGPLNPIKHWRKQLQPSQGHITGKPTVNQVMWQAGGSIYLGTDNSNCLNTDASNVCQPVLSNYLYKYYVDNSCCDVVRNKLSNFQPVAFNNPTKIIRPRSSNTIIKKNYYTTGAAYLRSRVKLYEQNQILSPSQPSNAYVVYDNRPKAGDNYVYPSNSKTSGSQLYNSTYCITDSSACCDNPNPPCTKSIIYKPSNPFFSKQGAVSSSTRILQQRYQTITKNNNDFITDLSVNTVGNATIRLPGATPINYRGETSAAYFIKSKYQQINVCVPDYYQVSSHYKPRLSRRMPSGGSGIKTICFPKYLKDGTANSTNFSNMNFHFQVNYGTADGSGAPLYNYLDYKSPSRGFLLELSGNSPAAALFNHYPGIQPGQPYAGLNELAITFYPPQTSFTDQYKFTSFTIPVNAFGRSSSGTVPGLIAYAVLNSDFLSNWAASSSSNTETGTITSRYIPNMSALGIHDAQQQITMNLQTFMDLLPINTTDPTPPGDSPFAIQSPSGEAILKQQGINSFADDIKRLTGDGYLAVVSGGSNLSGGGPIPDIWWCADTSTNVLPITGLIPLYYLIYKPQQNKWNVYSTIDQSIKLTWDGNPSTPYPGDASSVVLSEKGGGISATTGTSSAITRDISDAVLGTTSASYKITLTNLYDSSANIFWKPENKSIHMHIKSNGTLIDSLPYLTITADI